MKSYLSIKTILFISLGFITGFVQAAAIYPIDQASILAGSKFDIKIEFNTVINPEEAAIELNGAPINKTIGTKPEFIANENGKGSSILFRDV